MADLPDLAQLKNSIDTLIRLTALNLIAGRDGLGERVALLSRAGLAAKDIATLCDTTPNTVSVQLYKSKQASRAPKRKR